MPASLWYVSEECVTSVWNIRMDLEENMEKVLQIRNGTFCFRAFNGMQSNVRLILLVLHCFLLVLLYDSIRVRSFGFLHTLYY